LVASGFAWNQDAEFPCKITNPKLLPEKIKDLQDMKTKQTMVAVSGLTRATAENSLPER
jgi:hypothetical protein